MFPFIHRGVFDYSRCLSELLRIQVALWPMHLWSMGMGFANGDGDDGKLEARCAR
jgi:hypothetical protein